MARFDLTILGCCRLRLARLYSGTFIQRQSGQQEDLHCSRHGVGWWQGPERQETHLGGSQESERSQTMDPYRS